MDSENFYNTEKFRSLPLIQQREIIDLVEGDDLPIIFFSPRESDELLADRNAGEIEELKAFVRHRINEMRRIHRSAWT